MVVHTDLHHDVSPPLSALAEMAQHEITVPRLGEAEEVRSLPKRAGFKPPQEPDPVLQRSAAATTAPITAPITPNIINNFDGIGQGVFGISINLAPPDTNGAVGLTQYVQWVNVEFAVFDKATGTIAPNFPVAGSTLWKGFGGPCESNNDGDPVVIYDRLNDRWVFGQFAIRQPGGFLTNTLQCVAVSTSSDVTGTYNRYSFEYDNELNDYPKMSTWSDGYYVTFNMFGFPSFNFIGGDACAYDGAAMRAGQPATQICFQQVTPFGGALPADVDGHNPPPAGSPNYVVDPEPNSLDLYKFHVDFAHPQNSTFGPAIIIPVAPFTPLCNGQRNCVPQAPGDSFTLLDSLSDRLMYRLAYRNFGDRESLVLNHSVQANSDGSGGIRWYELQDPNGTPKLVQQATYSPDSSYRWMGSVAMDQSGDLALGYSVSSTAIHPAIAVATRTPNDPLNTLSAETSIFNGTGSQTGGLTRWGDYSAMQLDPVDDCTFWFTTEYLKLDGNFNWNTRIASFKFDGCGLPDLAVTSTHTGNFTQGDGSDTYTISVKNVGGKPTDGSLVTMVDSLPTGLTALSISGTGWSCTLATLTCTRTDALAARTPYPDITLTVKVAANAPGTVTNAATVSGGGDSNANNNAASDTTTVIQTGPDPAITKTHTGTFIQGQTGTYTITVTNTGLSPTDGTAVTVSDSLPTGFTLNSASGTGWSCGTSNPVTCTRSDALASNASYPAITLVVNVASNAASSLTNTATVSGGGDTNPLNNSASDKTSIIPPPPDLTITKTHAGNFNQGAIGIYTIIVNNIGSTPTSGPVTVTDPLPSGMTPVLFSGNGWSCIGFTTVSCSRSDALAPGANYPPLDIEVRVGSDVPQSVTNTATVSGGGEINTGNDTASDPTTVTPSPDLTVAAAHSPEPMVSGQTGTFKFTVTNAGHAPTNAPVNLTSFFPFGFVGTAISAPGWSCPQPPFANFSCTRSDALANGSSYPDVVVTVSVNASSGVFVNSAQVGGGGEFNTLNDGANDVGHVNAPLLTISKSHTGNFTVGQTGTYTITVGNAGQLATSGNVSLNDVLPTGMTVSSVSGTGWSCSTTNNGANCQRSDALSPGQNYPPITLVVNVDGSIQFTFVTNVATVTGGGDVNTHFAFDSTSINVPDLAINKTHTGDFTVGQQGTYTITVTNVGAVSTGGGTVIVNDSLPVPLTAASMSGTGWSCNLTTVSCTRPAGVLAQNNSYPPITLTVNVGSGQVGTVSNQVSVSGIADAGSANNFWSDGTRILGIGITPSSQSSQTVTAGSAANYTFLVTVPSTAGTVNFAASGLPANSKAIFSPSSLTATAIVTMTLDTSGNGHVAAGLQPSPWERLRSLYTTGFAVFGLLAIGTRRRNKRTWLRLGTLAIALLLVATFAACGGGGSHPVPNVVTTPQGSYTVTLTATGTAGGLPASSQQVVLTVR
jgi:uncharacterized repeat protein (TIGR01451 family)